MIFSRIMSDALNVTESAGSEDGSSDQHSLSNVAAIPVADVSPSTLEGGSVGQFVAANLSQSETSDSDSAIGESVLGPQSASLASSIRNYKYENGRYYHAYREGEYPLPNDELEQDRLDMLHHIWRLMIGRHLYRSPIAEDRPPPNRILDIGTGTGLWAIEAAEEFGQAIVIGTDLSPIQPGWVPPNCKFYVDDAESEWMYPPEEHFDFIHGRGLGGAIADWPKLYGQVHENLRPGGWLEMQEYETVIRSDDDSMNCATWTTEWVQQLETASRKFGKRMNVAHLQRKWIEDAGFVNVHDDIFKVTRRPKNPQNCHTNRASQIPIGTWAKDQLLKEIGRYVRAQVIDAIEPFTVALYTRVLGYTLDHTWIVIAMVKRELSDPKLHLYVIYHFIYGRKPENG